MNLKQLFNHTKDRINQNFILLFLLMIFIGTIRNSIEMIGYFTKSTNFIGYYPTIPSFLDTICYVFFMVIAEGYIINLLFGGDGKKLRMLVQNGVWLLLGLFILIPVLNNMFNYHFFHFQNFYSLEIISPYLYPHYGTFGLHVAFLLVLFVFPYWLRNLYNSSLFKSFLITWLVYIPHYLITYQLMMNFNWGYLTQFNPFYGCIEPVNVYTSGFVFMTLLVYPLFMKGYPKNKKEFRRTVVVYFILWAILIFLFFNKIAWKP